MTQLVLANQLHEQAVADFKVSERFAYSFIMKVKQIRDDRLYKELGFQAFEDYCEKAWNVKRDYMDQRIQIADSLGEAYFADTYRQIGHSKSLLLARMEPEIRQQVETQVDVNDATVKQIKEAERRAQEAERAAQLAQQETERAINDRHHFEKLYRNELNRQPQTVTKTVEVVPDDYEDLKQQAIVAQKLNTENVQLKRASEQMRQTYEEKLNQQQQRDFTKKELNKHLTEQIRAITMNHDSAIFNYTAIQGDREAHDMVMRYLQQYEAIIKQQLNEWEQLTSIRAVN